MAEPSDDLFQARAFKPSLQDYHWLLNYSPDGILMGDPSGRILEANPRACELTGFSREELFGRPFQSLFSPDSISREPLRFDLLDPEKVIAREREFLHRDGSRLPIEMKSVRLPDGRLLSYFHDLTTRKRTEEALQTSDAQHLALISAIPDLLFLNARDGTYLAWHAGNEGQLLLPPEAFMGRKLGEVLPPSLAASFTQAMDRVFNTGELQNLEYELPLGDDTRAFEARIAPGPSDTCFTVVRDVTASRRAERALRESERRYLDLFQNTPDSVFWVLQDEDGGFRIESVNPAQAALLGVPATAMEHKRLEEILPPELEEGIAARYRECLRQESSTSYEEAATLGGVQRWFHTLLVPVRDGAGKMTRLVGFSRDITQRKTAEAALLQAQKLESLGVLAGGIAHDFNNLLTAVLGNVNLAQLQLNAESPAHPYLESLEKTVLKASELTKQMLAYSGKGRFVVKLHDMNLVVQEMTHLLQVSISKRIALRFDLEPNLPSLEADGAQIQQVVMNLVTNASDAIGEADGVIGIRTGFERLDAAYIESAFPTQALKPGPCVFLEVSDTGCGMSPETQARIFDPFFTTKATGRGLGLSAMLGILKGHHAGLKIQSEAGRGTTFKLYFPASEAAMTPEVSLPQERKAIFQGLALVVDDEPVILETTEAALRYMGFTVLCARDGVEGLEVFRAHQEEVRLVLLDLTMPRMDGLETFQAIHQLRPDLPVILSSGYNEHESVQGFLGKGLAGFLQKPYPLKELRSVIASILSRGA